MPFPPPKALPIASVRAAQPLQDRDSLTGPMPGVRAKSNGMSKAQKSWVWTSVAGQGVVAA